MRNLLVSALLLAGLSGAAEAQERQWALDVGDTEAYLVFGVPESDDVGVSFWCTLRSGEISIFVPETDASLKPNRKVKFTVTAGGTTVTVTGKTTDNEEAASTSIEAKISDKSPIFAGILKTDRFKVKAGKSENVYPLIDADFAGLLEACRKP